MIINNKYSVKLLKNIRNDDIKSVFKSQSVLYIVNFPDNEWHLKHGINEIANYSVNKFSKLFDLVSNRESLILSPTFSKNSHQTKTYLNKKIQHIGSRFSNVKLKQIHLFLKSIIWLLKNKNKFEIILVHNFTFPNYYIALFSKYFLKNEIIIDFEDDYYCINKKSIQSIFFKKLFSKFDDKIIAINEKMIRYFPNLNKCNFFVFNGFIDLEYINNIEIQFFENIKFLYGGTLDEKRGAYLLPLFVLELKKIIHNFTIYVTGNLQIELDVYLPYNEIKFLGFVNEIEYNTIISEVDACLVFQLPDNEFNMGSFPSKIEDYSLHKKPILCLELI